MRISQQAETGPPLTKPTTWSEEIKWMEQFIYLGSVLTSTSDSSKYIKRRLVLATTYFISLLFFLDK